ncbi:MAG: hypothetical protein JWM16_4728 [Verrucomicrobiales bacterium]|nr:hypothetical protein [Verrucomicrobiales bacterium]
MQKNLRLKNVLLGAVAGVLITLSLAAATGAVRATWEYKVVSSYSVTNDEINKMLNKLGVEQWELVSSTYTAPGDGSGNNHTRYVFKRQR